MITLCDFERIDIFMLYQQRTSIALSRNVRGRTSAARDNIRRVLLLKDPQKISK
jgi:hypothetical protein